MAVLRYDSPESLGLCAEQSPAYDEAVDGLPPEIAALVRTVIEHVSQGRAVTLLVSSQLLTTTQAAAALGISRPTLYRLLDEEVLPAVMVGAHRKVPADSVAAYQLLREARLSSPEFDAAIATMRHAGVHDADLDDITDADVSDEAARIADQALQRAFDRAAAR